MGRLKTAPAQPNPDDPSAPTERKFHSAFDKLVIGSYVARATASPTWAEDRLQAFSQSIGVLRPPQGDGGIILAACNDVYYWRFVPTLVLSIERQLQHQIVHLHLYAPAAAVLDHVSVLRQKLNYVELYWTIDRCSLAKPLEYPAVYLTSARFMLATLLLRETNRPILCIDVDGLAIKPVWPAYEPIRMLGDIGMIFRPGARTPWRRILASAVGFNPTSSGKQFSSTIARSLAALYQRRPRYHVDQLILHYASRLDRFGRHPATFFQMPLQLSDHQFGDDAVIWTAKGRRNKNSLKFISQQRLIEAQSSEIGVSLMGTKAAPDADDAGPAMPSSPDTRL